MSLTATCPSTLTLFTVTPVYGDVGFPIVTYVYWDFWLLVLELTVDDSHTSATSSSLLVIVVRDRLWWCVCYSQRLSFGVVAIMMVAMYVRAVDEVETRDMRDIGASTLMLFTLNVADW